MHESGSGIISLKDYDQCCVDILAEFLRRGRGFEHLVQVPKLPASKLYMLLELLSYIEMTRAFLHISKSRALHITDSFDFPFMMDALKQVATCPVDLRDAWKHLLTIAVMQLEEHLTSSDFHSLSFEELRLLISEVQDEQLPEEFWTPQGGERFYAAAMLKGDEVDARVHVRQCHPFAFTLDSKKVGQFRLTLRAEAPCKYRYIQETTSLTVATDCGYPGFFGDRSRQESYCPGLRLEDLELSFKAGMTRLHRQAYALTAYACHQTGVPFFSACQGDQLLGAVAFFYEHAADEGASALSLILEEYAARSFDLIKGSDGWRRLPLPLLSRILARDCLAAKEEADVLAFVLRHSMAATGVAASPPTAKKAGTSRASQAKQSQPSTVFSKLAQHVRFPFIPQERLRGAFSASERAFLSRQPCYASLVEEAAAAQKRSRPERWAPDPYHRKQRRARYDAIPFWTSSAASGGSP